MINILVLREVLRTAALKTKRKNTVHAQYYFHVSRKFTIGYERWMVQYGLILISSGSGRLVQWYDWSELFCPLICIELIYIRTFLSDIRGKWISLRNSRKKIRGLNGVFWGRVGLFGSNLHFCFGLLDVTAGKRKQYLNSKENKKEEKRTQKTDTKTLPRGTVQESTRPWRKWRRRTL